MVTQIERCNCDSPNPSSIKPHPLGNMGDYKSVGRGVAECRFNYGPGYSVYFGKHGNAVVILLSGGTKKSQAKDIELAKEYWADYKRRQL